MTNDRNIIAEADGYQLVRYASGESCIEHPASRTCSLWLTADEEAEIMANPAVMSEWALDESMDADEEEPEIESLEDYWNGCTNYQPPAEFCRLSVAEGQPSLSVACEQYAAEYGRDPLNGDCDADRLAEYVRGEWDDNNPWPGVTAEWINS